MVFFRYNSKSRQGDLPFVSFQELWALIMDAGTGFTSQAYQLSQQFLPKVGEGEKRKGHFNINGLFESGLLDPGSYVFRVGRGGSAHSA